jgi:hypothetical protein
MRDGVIFPGVIVFAFACRLRPSGASKRRRTRPTVCGTWSRRRARSWTRHASRSTVCPEAKTFSMYSAVRKIRLRLVLPPHPLTFVLHHAQSQRQSHVDSTANLYNPRQCIPQSLSVTSRRRRVPSRTRRRHSRTQSSRSGTHTHATVAQCSPAEQPEFFMSRRLFNVCVLPIPF